MSDRPITQLSETLARLGRYLGRALRSQSSLTADAAAKADRVALVAKVAMAHIVQLWKLEEPVIPRGSAVVQTTPWPSRPDRGVF